MFGFLGLGLIAFSVLFALSVFYSFQARSLLNKTQQGIEILNQVKEIRYYFGSARKDEKNWFLFRSENYLQSLELSLGMAKNLFEELRKKVADTPELALMVETLGGQLLQYISLGEQLAELKAPKAIRAFTEKAKATDEKIVEQVAAITNYFLQKVDEDQRNAAQIFQTYFIRSIFILSLGFIIFLGAGSLWAFHFKRRLQRLILAAQKMALGDYVPNLEDSSQDELGLLATHFNEMASKIAQREEKINQITEELIHANNLLKKEKTA